MSQWKAFQQKVSAAAARIFAKPLDNPAVNFAQVLKDEDDEIQRLFQSRLKDPQKASGDCGTSPRFGLALSGGGIRSAAVNLGLLQALAKCGLLEGVHYVSAISGGGYILAWLTTWVRRAGFKEVNQALAGKHEALPAPGGLPRFLEPHPLRFLREYTSYLTPRVGLTSGDTFAMVSIYVRNVLLNLTMIAAWAFVIVAGLQMLAPVFSWVRPLTKNHQLSLLGIGALASLLTGLIAGHAMGRVGSDQSKPEPHYAGRNSVICACTAAVCFWFLLPTMLDLSCVLRQRLGDFAAPCVAAAYVLVCHFTGWLADALSFHQLLKPVDQRIWRRILIALLASLCSAGFSFWVAYEARHLLTDQGLVYVSDWYVIFGLPCIMLTLALASYINIGILGNALPDAKREWHGRLSGWFLFLALVLAIVLVGALRGPMLMSYLHHKANAAAGGGSWLKWVLPGGWLSTVIAGLFAAKSPRTGNRGTDRNRLLDTLAKVAPPLFLAGAFLLISWGVYSVAQTFNAGDYLANYRPGFEGPPFKITQMINADGATQILERVVRPDVHVSRSGVLWCSYFVNEAVKAQPLWLIVLFGGMIGTLLAGRLDVNEFSMHLFYRNRLVRAFLGASNHDVGKEKKSRNPSPFTGFALDDDMSLQNLLSSARRDPSCDEPGGAGDLSHDRRWWDLPKRSLFTVKSLWSSSTLPSQAVPKAAETWYDGPYPIWGTALNLTTGEELAYQKRKAASFIYSPLYCGWDQVDPETASQCEKPDADTDCNQVRMRRKQSELCKYAYRRTGPVSTKDGAKSKPYTGHGCGPSIGTAMAASGAAISPNWGYHTTPAVAALLAMFNVRIGWWTGNPRRKDCWDRYAPSVMYLLSELAGATNDASRYVYLSDGGHFENLGIYELVRRRARYIIACDADADPNYEFGDLANAVEKCRRDFGVEIKIDVSRIRPDDKTAFSGAHFAVGEIQYPSSRCDHTGPTTGSLLYLKSSVTAKNTMDVLGQRTAGSKFPHDTTLNQFFDETQFEAYRALGEQMFASAWKDAVDSVRADTRNIFQDAEAGKGDARKTVELLFETLR